MAKPTTQIPKGAEPRFLKGEAYVPVSVSGQVLQIPVSEFEKIAGQDNVQISSWKEAERLAQVERQKGLGPTAATAGEAFLSGLTGGVSDIGARVGSQRDERLYGEAGKARHEARQEAERSAHEARPLVHFGAEAAGTLALPVPGAGAGKAAVGATEAGARMAESRAARAALEGGASSLRGGEAAALERLASARLGATGTAEEIAAARAGTVAPGSAARAGMPTPRVEVGPSPLMAPGEGRALESMRASAEAVPEGAMPLARGADNAARAREGLGPLEPRLGDISPEGVPQRIGTAAEGQARFTPRGEPLAPGEAMPFAPVAEPGPAQKFYTPGAPPEYVPAPGDLELPKLGLRTAESKAAARAGTGKRFSLTPEFMEEKIRQGRVGFDELDRRVPGAIAEAGEVVGPGLGEAAAPYARRAGEGMAEPELALRPFRTLEDRALGITEETPALRGHLERPDLASVQRGQRFRSRREAADLNLDKRAYLDRKAAEWAKEQERPDLVLQRFAERGGAEHNLAEFRQAEQAEIDAALDNWSLSGEQGRPPGSKLTPSAAARESAMLRELGPPGASAGERALGRTAAGEPSPSVLIRERLAAGERELPSFRGPASAEAVSLREAPTPSLGAFARETGGARGGMAESPWSMARSAEEAAISSRMPSPQSLRREGFAGGMAESPWSGGAAAEDLALAAEAEGPALAERLREASGAGGRGAAKEARAAVAKELRAGGMAKGQALREAKRIVQRQMQEAPAALEGLAEGAGELGPATVRPGAGPTTMRDPWAKLRAEGGARAEQAAAERLERVRGAVGEDPARARALAALAREGNVAGVPESLGGLGMGFPEPPSRGLAGMAEVAPKPPGLNPRLQGKVAGIPSRPGADMGGIRGPVSEVGPLSSSGPTTAEYELAARQRGPATERMAPSTRPGETLRAVEPRPGQLEPPGTKPSPGAHLFSPEEVEAGAQTLRRPGAAQVVPPGGPPGGAGVNPFAQTLVSGKPPPVSPGMPPGVAAATAPGAAAAPQLMAQGGAQNALTQMASQAKAAVADQVTKEGAFQTAMAKGMGLTKEALIPAQAFVYGMTSALNADLLADREVSLGTAISSGVVSALLMGAAAGTVGKVAAMRTAGKAGKVAAEAMAEATPTTQKGWGAWWQKELRQAGLRRLHPTRAEVQSMEKSVEGGPLAVGEYVVHDLAKAAGKTAGTMTDEEMIQAHRTLFDHLQTRKSALAKEANELVRTGKAQGESAVALVNSLDQKISELRKTYGGDDYIPKVERFRDAWIDMHHLRDPMTGALRADVKMDYEELRKFSEWVRKTVYADTLDPKMTPLRETLAGVRRIAEGRMESAMGEVFGEAGKKDLVAKFNLAKHKFQAAKYADEMITREAAKEIAQTSGMATAVSLAARAAMGAAVGGPMGALMFAASSRAGSRVVEGASGRVMLRMMESLSGGVKIAAEQEAMVNALQKGVEDFVNADAAKAAPRPGMMVNVSKMGELVDGVKRMAANPMASAGAASKAASDMAQIDPAMGMAAQSGIHSALRYLAAKAPVAYTEDFSRKDAAVKYDPWQMREFAEAYQAIVHPESVLHDAMSGSVSPHKIEAIKQGNPEAYQLIQQYMKLGLAKKGTHVPAFKAGAASQVLGYPVTGAYHPAMIKSFGDTYMQLAGQKAPAGSMGTGQAGGQGRSATRARAVDIAPSFATTTQRHQGGW